MTSPVDPKLVGLVVERTMEIATIPAPPLREERRRDLVLEWWASDGLHDVKSDQLGNVWGVLRRGRLPAVLVAAHLDTVFGEDVEHFARRADDVLFGPGVGDNSVAVAALSTLDALLPHDSNREVLIVATTGEEGLGNLAGIRHALDHPPVGIGALIAVEGAFLGRVVTRSIGSARFRISLVGPGGHAWSGRHNTSAVHQAAEMIVQLANLAEGLPSPASVNVGVARGGEGINSRAREAMFEVDLRSEDPQALATLVAEMESVVSEAKMDLAVHRSEIGRRPAGRMDIRHPLVQAARMALSDVGIEPVDDSASTDANAAHPRGIPAITIGVTTGDGLHTLAESIDLPPIASGLAALAATVLRFAPALEESA